MTIDDYLGVRMVSTPLCLYDCDVPADGSTAVIVSPGRRRARPAPPAGADRGDGHRAARPPVVGPVRRPHHDGAARRGGDDVGAHRPAPGRRRRGRAVRRLQLHHAVLARGARLLRARRGRPVPRGRAAASPPTARSRSTPTAASCRPAGSTATASSTRPASSCGARRASVSWRAAPRSRSPAPAAARSPRACCSRPADPHVHQPLNSGGGVRGRRPCPRPCRRSWRPAPGSRPRRRSSARGSTRSCGWPAAW